MVFVLFIICITVSLILDISMIVPLAAGFFLFSYLAVKKGYSVKDILKMSFASVKETMIVVGVLLIIGGLTGVWRISGTIAYFVSAGITVLPSSLFLLSAFLLCAVMSFAIGTSFGVTGTAGVILMTIARAGGVHPVPAAAAILSGVYVGDRGSPAASSGNLVAAMTGTDMRINIRKMMKSAAVPFAAACVVYGVLSVFYPLEQTETSILTELAAEFRLEWLCLVPAILMIVLPFLKVPVKWAMLASMTVSFLLAVFLQQESLADCLRALFVGYTPENRELNALLSGGGVKSMLNVAVILLISGTYGGIFRETHLLDSLTEHLLRLKERIGRYPVMVLLSAAVSAVFCNQTIGVIMLTQLSSGLYRPEENYVKMLDMEDSVIVIAGLVPWCIASSVPCAILGVGPEILPLAVYLWMIPMWRLLAGNRDSVFRR